ncbi:MAG: PAS domain-containing protein [Eubacteriales bacterium]|nr:PAS domain-containing protein [Eubacteriales bacterium]
MNIKAGQAEAAVLGFFNAYMVRRDLEGTLSYLTQDVQWVGTGKQELAASGKEVKHILEEEFSVDPQGYSFTPQKIYEQVTSPASAAVLLTAVVSRGDEAVDMRVSAACVMCGDECRISSIHASTPNVQQEEGEFFPSVNESSDRQQFERTVGIKTLDLLGKSIPGGIMGGYVAPGFPLYYINDRMLEHLGYTYQEFKKDTKGYVCNGIHPDDRGMVNRIVSAALAKGQEYEVQYRMKKKDGTYIWVNDVGKQVMAQDGRALCISVVRDISQEVTNKIDLEEDAREKEKQAKRYNELFQSVLCGIVQYRLDEEGRVIFENANQEAIRIFGYEPEEFWAKDDWDLPALIVEEDRDRILREVSRLQKVGDKNEYEYRVQRRDGSSCWIIGSAKIILSENGKEIIQSVFLDIDARKRTEQRNRILSDQVAASSEVLKRALEHTTTCEFYYYPEIRLCTIPQRICEYYHIKTEYENVPQSLAEECVAEEFREDFCKMFREIHRGKRTASSEFRTREGTYWIRVTLTVISYQADGRPDLVVGILEEITQQKEMELALEDARSKDPMTGLYNKDTGIRMVQQYLLKKPSNECCCLMLLDMDNFKEINKVEGSAFADAILQEVASILKSETGTDAVITRLGGDEFMLFKRGCNKARATVVGPRIAEQVKEIIAWPKGEKEVGISVSIGMCVTDVAEDYNSLYRCAESALKYVKENTKGQAACYLDTSNELGISLTQLYEEEHPLNAIDRVNANEDEDLVSFALELLGKSKKLDDAVFLLLSRIGKNFHVDRVSILEINKDYLSMKFTYQWARRRNDFKLGTDFYFSSEQLEEISSMYSEEGLSNGNPYPQAFTMASGLHAGIWDGGEYVGDMSFEVNEDNYQWPDEQRKLLKELVKIVPSFFMKAKANAISQAKTDFLSRMSHEIRTPMNAISGMTAIAKSVLDDKEKAAECLEKIESANVYLLNLINDILDMSRIESGKIELNYEAIDIKKFLDSLETLLKPQAVEKGVSLVIENGYREDRLLEGDGLRLNQVLINIIGNAVKFTGSGGMVIVKVTQKEKENGVYLCFSVRDTGIGIEASALERIFNVFEQADRKTAASHGGTGLGLAISSSLVQLMGGKLEVRSKVGKGSEFFFTIPFGFAPEQGQEQPDDHSVEADYGFEGKRLLLAEDNKLNQDIARTLLEMQGFLVECADNGQQALDMFQEHAPGYYDAVLMDIRMPVMDGLESARRIRTLGRPDSRTIPIIAQSANAFDGDSKKSLESGMNGHLSKPIQTEQLLEMLGKLL